MKFWNVASSMEGELFVSTHLTERGAMKAAIFDCMDFLGVEDGDSRMTNHASPNELETDHQKIMAMDEKDLLHALRLWFEETWDNDCGYNIEIVRSSLQA